MSCGGRRPQLSDVSNVSQNKLLAEWFWIDRWVGSSAFSLPIDARGLYREMLTQAWRREARLPNDHDQIRRMTGVTMREWKRLWPKVRRYWHVSGDELLNDTQVEVYKDAKGRADRAVERATRAAQASAQARAQGQLKHRGKRAQAQAQARAQGELEQSPLITVADQVPPVVPLKGGRGFTKRELRRAMEIRKNRFGRCFHDPTCASPEACVRAIAGELRAKAS